MAQLNALYFSPLYYPNNVRSAYAEPPIGKERGALPLRTPRIQALYENIAQSPASASRRFISFSFSAFLIRSRVNELCPWVYSRSYQFSLLEEKLSVESEEVRDSGKHFDLLLSPHLQAIP